MTSDATGRLARVHREVCALYDELGRDPNASRALRELAEALRRVAVELDAHPGAVRAREVNATTGAIKFEDPRTGALLAPDDARPPK